MPTPAPPLGTVTGAVAVTPRAVGGRGSAADHQLVAGRGRGRHGVAAGADPGRGQRVRRRRHGARPARCQRPTGLLGRGRVTTGAQIDVAGDGLGDRDHVEDAHPGATARHRDRRGGRTPRAVGGRGSAADHQLVAGRGRGRHGVAAGADPGRGQRVRRRRHGARPARCQRPTGLLGRGRVTTGAQVDVAGDGLGDRDHVEDAHPGATARHRDRRGGRTPRAVGRRGSAADHQLVAGRGRGRHGVAAGADPGRGQRVGRRRHGARPARRQASHRTARSWSGYHRRTSRCGRRWSGWERHS